MKAILLCDVGKVLKKLHIFLAKDDIDDLVQCRPGAVEHLLVKLQLKVRWAGSVVIYVSMCV